MTTKNKWYAFNTMYGVTEISIYDEIGMWGITAKDFAKDLKETPKGQDINLHINSPGGSVTDGIAIYNMLKRHEGAVHVFIDGIAASMASVIAMAGNTITMPENTLMMIHNPWGGAIGDAEELRKTADVLDKMKESLISAYASKSGKDHDEISQIMDAETWYTGAEAVEHGFATDLEGEVQLAASFDLSKLDNYKNQFFKPSAKAEETNEENSMGKSVQGPATSEAADKIDPKAVEENAISAYKARQQERKASIRKTFGAFADQYGDLLNTCLDDDECTPAQASEKLLNALGKTAKPAQGGFAHCGHVGNGEIIKDSLGAAIKARAGVHLEDGEMSKDNPFRSMTLVEMARASLDHKGVGTASIGDRMQLVGAAFTHSSSDFTSVLADVANKSMLKGYEEAPETFERWTQRGNLSDFKIAKRADLNTFPSLLQVPEGGEYKSATLSDRSETIALATYGRKFSITRQAIINDDLRAFTVIPARMGRAARRTIGNLVYAVLTDNPAMSDGTALFHADHSNYVAGASTALSVDALKEARKNFRLQKDATGNLLQITPEFLIVPAALETDAEILMNDTVYPGKSNNQRNPVANMAEVIVEPRLDDSSAKAWYLAAGSAFDTIEVAYLDGNSNPFLDQLEGWNVDGTEFKVRIDAGVSPLEYATMYKAKGEA